MKSFILAVSLVLTGATTAVAQESNAGKAIDLFDLRGYDQAGITNVEKSVEYFEKAIAETADDIARMSLQNQQAEAYFFLGTAYSDKTKKQLAFRNGMDEAQEVIDALDVKDSHKLDDQQILDLQSRLTDLEIDVLCLAMYQKGTNLAQWGKLEGIATSIGRIDEVIGNMENIEKLGKESIHYYGPARTLGRVKYTLPVIFGGSLTESEKILRRAVKSTLAVDASGKKLRYSVHGFNNIYLAETMHKRGKEKQAILILKNFINADPATLAPDRVPENTRAGEVARDLADEWKVHL